MGFEQLKQILENNRIDAEAEKTKEIVQCPQCSYIPLKTNSRGEKSCPICEWTNAF